LAASAEQCNCQRYRIEGAAAQKPAGLFEKQLAQKQKEAKNNARQQALMSTS